MYTLLLVMLVASVSCHPFKDRPTKNIDQSTALHKALVTPTREKRFVMPVLATVMRGGILGTAGEIVTSVGTGLLGAKAGMQHGALASRILNNGGDWGYLYSGPMSPYNYDVPNYGYYGPTYWDGYYGPNNPYGYYGPSSNGYSGPGPSGYYGPSNGNNGGNNGSSGYASSYRP